MLPHYTPLKVAEVFRTLHALYPGRIDLGIGRAPGGGPIEALALKRDRKTKMLDDFPEQVSELLAFLNHGETGHSFPAGHPICGNTAVAGYAGRAGCVDAGIKYVERRSSGGVWAALFVCALFQPSAYAGGH
jgi:alkanesulfonate monooxygenase SsuD/methylene tetrahydromethanopterin reductase-like flavin-dependent oxidoreductase (luciferase family)